MTDLRGTYGQDFGLAKVRWRPWREISAVSLLLMELSWLIAWHSSLGWPGEWTVKASLFLFYGALVSLVYWSSKVMFWLQLRRNAQRAVLGLQFLLSYFFILSQLLYSDQPFSVSMILTNLEGAFQSPSVLLPHELTLFILCAYLVLRSAILAPSWIGVGVVSVRFRLGTVALLVLSSLNLSLPLSEIRGEIYIFLFSSFMAFGAARISSLYVLRGGIRHGFSFQSVSSVLSSAIIVTGSAYLLGGLASSSLSQPVANLFFIAMRLLFIVFVLLASPIFFLGLIVITWLGGNSANFPIIAVLELEIKKVLQMVTDFVIMIVTLIQNINIRLPDLRWLRPYFLWGMAGFFMILLLRELGRGGYSLRQIGDSFIEEQTSKADGTMRAWVRKAFDDQIKKISQRLKVFDRSGYFSALRIRRIYAQLTKLCGRLDVPRADTATPLEFLDELELLFPDESLEVSTITHAYNRVRYGELPEMPEEVRAVEIAWRVVRKRGRDLQALQT